MLSMMLQSIFYFLFNDTATTEIYTLSLHDALPIYQRVQHDEHAIGFLDAIGQRLAITIEIRRRGQRYFRDAAKSRQRRADRKSTRLNSSHPSISYAVFCLKKKKHTVPSAFVAERRT